MSLKTANYLRLVVYSPEVEFGKLCSVSGCQNTSVTAVEFGTGTAKFPDDVEFGDDGEPLEEPSIVAGAGDMQEARCAACAERLLHDILRNQCQYWLYKDG